MAIISDLYINGAWTKGTGRLPVYDPSDGSVIAEVATSDDALCMAAVDAAEGAAKSWAATAPRVRGEILRRALPKSIHLLKSSLAKTEKFFPMRVMKSFTLQSSSAGSPKKRYESTANSAKHRVVTSVFWLHINQ